MDWEMSQANDQLRTVSIRDSKEPIFSFFPGKFPMVIIHDRVEEILRNLFVLRKTDFQSSIREKIREKVKWPVEKVNCRFDQELQTDQ